MMTKQLTDAIRRAESWPVRAQEELARYAAELEVELRGDLYAADEEELAGIDRGLAAARAGRFVGINALEAVFAKYRPA
jgi:predicted transcriptional regulator